MFESIYVRAHGLASFSRNLTVIGNNVSNLNSPGFKASQLQFADLMYAHQGGASGASMQLGAGVDTGATRTLFKQGALGDRQRHRRRGERQRVLRFALRRAR